MAIVIRRYTLGVFIMFVIGLATWASHPSWEHRAPKFLHHFVGKPSPSTAESSRFPSQSSAPSSLPLTADVDKVVDVVETTSRYLVNYPTDEKAFGEMGQRAQILMDWIQSTETPGELSDLQQQGVSREIERLTLSLFPFIKDPSHPNDPTPFNAVRQRYTPGSKGIVIPTGKGTFRYACHLVSSLRDVLDTSLPIQIAYAGDDDLPQEYRTALTELGTDIETFDVTTVFDEAITRLKGGGWAIKAFAILGSRFEQVILMDADSVFLQSPDVIFDRHPGYAETGTLLFHDRLLFQGAFQERHEWWRKQMAHQRPSTNWNHSLVHQEDYGEEGDSGVVAIDKGRIPVLVGLLHICWQNTHAVRDLLYAITYGDKESWWFGFELCGVPYVFEEPYGSVVGPVDPVKGVCAFDIAHVDERRRLLWWNGSLLRNKMRDPHGFEVPSHWMLDGTWEKGATKPDMSCMHDGTLVELDDAEKAIIQRNIDAAKHADERVKQLLDVQN